MAALAQRYALGPDYVAVSLPASTRPGSVQCQATSGMPLLSYVCPDVERTVFLAGRPEGVKSGFAHVRNVSLPDSLVAETIFLPDDDGLRAALFGDASRGPAAGLGPRRTHGHLLAVAAGDADVCSSPAVGRSAAAAG